MWYINYILLSHRSKYNIQKKKTRTVWARMKQQPGQNIKHKFLLKNTGFYLKFYCRIKSDCWLSIFFKRYSHSLNIAALSHCATRFLLGFFSWRSSDSPAANRRKAPRSDSAKKNRVGFRAQQRETGTNLFPITFLLPPGGCCGIWDCALQSGDRARTSQSVADR